MPELACNDLIGDLWEWDGREEALGAEFPVVTLPFVTLRCEAGFV